MVGFTPAGRVEQFFRELDARGKYSGTGANEDREAARQRYGTSTSNRLSLSEREVLESAAPARGRSDRGREPQSLAPASGPA
jgi:hypothetical protein